MMKKFKQASKSLKQKKKNLISSFLKGKKPAFLKQHTRILDEYFREGHETSLIGPETGAIKNSCAIIAVGGYGRQEQCIHSDIDLVFLFNKEIPDKADNLIREVLYPLWDIGLDIGYAARSLKECVSLAKKDIEVLTSLLDARFICGISSLYSELMELVRKKILLKQSKKIISALIENNRKRHQRFGDSTYLLEPNLKEGCGGLRDYHTMLWIAKIKSNIKQPRDLEYYGYLSHEEYNALTNAISFIWNVRNRLQHLAGRKCDHLYFEYQIKLAKDLNFKKENGQEPVERFLGKLHSRMELLKEQLLMFLYEQSYTKRSGLKTKSTKQVKVNGLSIIRNRLNFRTPEDILSSPDLLIKIFEESARLNIPLDAEAKRLVKDFAYLIDDDFRSSAFAAKSFQKILVTYAPTLNVLNEMLSAGFLVRFIPEIKGIVNRFQYDEYHLYPVDKHMLHTVQTIKNFGTSKDTSNDPLYGKLYKQLTGKKLMLWAALLHDVGKREPGAGHSHRGALIVRSILTAKHLKPTDIEAVVFLVENHLLLIKTATRRDINDEQTAITCAGKIKDVKRLKMLYLLTVADSISTGPKAWSSWTSALLKNLFLEVHRILEKGELATEEAIELIEKKKKELFVLTSTLLPRQDLEALFNVMSPRYLLYTPTQDMLEHIRLYKSLGKADFVWNVIKAHDSNTRTVTICAKDRPGLFSKIAGIFTLNSLDILDTQAYTWKNNTALDIFKVKPPPDQIFEDEKWIKAKKNLKDALSGKLNLGEALDKKISYYRASKPHDLVRPHRINVDNKSSSFFTIIEVFTYDFPGLLFKITDALYRCGLDIRVAKIATKVDQVVDVFYVRDFEGQKIDSVDQIDAIKAAIEKVLVKT
ncbi:MAG: [protein-PII] uridylyltransferase [Desulfobacteraceae bacterium]|nr:[protein-PII] uridylyltransferase [Desulfobacteraceae bacterium]